MSKTKTSSAATRDEMAVEDELYASVECSSEHSSSIESTIAQLGTSGEVFDRPVIVSLIMLTAAADNSMSVDADQADFAVDERSPTDDVHLVVENDAEAQLSQAGTWIDGCPSLSLTIDLSSLPCEADPSHPSIHLGDIIPHKLSETTAHSSPWLLSLYDTDMSTLRSDTDALPMQNTGDDEREEGRVGSKSGREAAEDGEEVGEDESEEEDGEQDFFGQRFELE